MRKQAFFLILIPIISFLYCSKDAEPDPEPQDPDPVQISIDQLEGYAQKGPYIAGTQIQMRELNENLSQTGSQFSTQIENDQGFFSIENITLESQYVEFSGIGFYFNEVSGEISSANLSLQTLSDVNNRSSLNINILSHLEQKRVEYLFTEENMDFSDAKTQAINEIFNIFCMSSVNNVASEDLNLLSSGDLNARLLAISLILQGQLSVGQLSELLYNIGDDIETDGVLNEEDLLNQLKSAAAQLANNNTGGGFSEINYNIQQRMEELEVTDYVIPDFENHIISFLECNSDLPAISDYVEVHDITSSSVEIRSWVTANSAETTVTLEYGPTEAYEFTAEAIQGTINGVNLSETFFQLDNLATTDIGQNYFFRVKAENSNGIVYSEFATCGNCDYNSDTTFFYLDGVLIDIEGNEYGTVQIGDQYWMKSNLTTTTYRNGMTFSSGLDGNIIATSLVDNIVSQPTNPPFPDGTYDWYRNDNWSGTVWTPTHPYQTHLEITVTNGVVTDVEVIIGGYNYRADEFSSSNLYILLDPEEYVDYDSYLHIILTEDDINTRGVWNYYDNDSSYEEIYGKWYNWNAANSPNGVCPEGWRIPTAEDIDILGNFLGTEDDNNPNGQWFDAGGAMKVQGLEYWLENVGGPNGWSSGFDAYPNGYVRNEIEEYREDYYMGERSWMWAEEEDSGPSQSAYFSTHDSSSNLTYNDGSANIIRSMCIRCIKEQ